MTEYRKQNPDKGRNHGVIVVGIVSIFLLVLFRLVQISVYKTAYQKNLTEDSVITVEEESSRGTIFDCQGDPIAVDRHTYGLTALLSNDWGEENVEDVDETARQLSQVLDMSQNEILDILSSSQSVQVEFGPQGKGLSEETRQTIEAMNLPGIQLNQEATRIYVNDHFASHFIGYVGENSEESGHGQTPVGIIGLEKSMNDTLSSDNKKTTSKDLEVTLDKRLQNYLEDLLEDSYQKYQPQNISGHLVEIPTGKLLATSQRPSFNLNTLEGIDDHWQHLLTQSMIEPGSTIKILTMASAFDKGVFTPDEKVKTGQVKVYDRIVKDHNNVGWGNIGFEEGLIRSSNVTTVELVKRIGENQWVSELEKYGFGKSTKSGFDDESEGDIELNNPPSKIMSGFGQAFSATPIQLLEAFSAIGNQGNKTKISYLNQVGGESVSHPVGSERVISEEAADYVLDLMVDTVELDIGTAQAFKHPTVTVAAKTGTAEIASEDGTGYLTGEDDYVHSVITFFPAEDPQFMVYLSMQQPSKNHGRIGSQMLGETFVPFVDHIMINQ